MSSKKSQAYQVSGWSACEAGYTCLGSAALDEMGSKAARGIAPHVTILSKAASGIGGASGAQAGCCHPVLCQHETCLRTGSAQPLATAGGLQLPPGAKQQKLYAQTAALAYWAVTSMHKAH